MMLKYVVQFNIFWLDPEAPESFPRGLLDAMGDDAYSLAPLAVRKRALDDIKARTRLDMEAAALQPLQPLDAIDEIEPVSAGKLEESCDDDTVTRTGEFLRLPVSDLLPTSISAHTLHHRPWSVYRKCFRIFEGSTTTASGAGHDMRVRTSSRQVALAPRRTIMTELHMYIYKSVRYR
jgi:hypothetical protein